MNIQRRMKYNSRGHTVNKSNVKLNMNFNISTLEIMASYSVSENRNIRRSQLMQMRNLFAMLDENLYIVDHNKNRYFNFIIKALEGRLEKNIKDSDILDKYINGGFIEDDSENSEEQIHISQLKVLSNPEVEWVASTISESLKYSYINNDMNELYELLVKFRASDYSSRGEIVRLIEDEIAKINNLFRKAKSEQAQEVTFTLKDGLFEETLREIHENVTNPSRRLYTGMQGFNELVGGALEAARVYMILGLTGGGKSFSLLNIAKQIKSNNRHYRPKDPTKIPVVVILTMENSVKETVERLFEMTTGEELKNVTADEAIKMLKEDGEMYIDDDNPIDILIKFVPNRSVDTSYLYTLAEDLEDEGYEMICLIQDHVKRIRSIEKTSDIRIELGNVVNEFKTFATLKDCVVITNSHLNREAAKSIDDGNRTNKGDLIRMIGRANISESMLMLDNVDVGLVIQQEYDEKGNKYMGFKRIKERIKCNPNFNIVYQMFKSPESLEFIEDLDKRVPLHKDTLKGDVNLINLNKMAEENKYKVLEDNNSIFDEEFNIIDYKNNIKTNNVNRKKHMLNYERKIG